MSGELPPVLALIFGLQQSVLVRAGGVAWPAVQRRPGTKQVLSTVHLYCAQYSLVEEAGGRRAGLPGGELRELSGGGAQLAADAALHPPEVTLLLGLKRKKISIR